MVIPGSKQEPHPTMVRHATLWQSLQSETILCTNAQRCFTGGLIIASSEAPVSRHQQATHFSGTCHFLAILAFGAGSDVGFFVVILIVGIGPSKIRWREFFTPLHGFRPMFFLDSVEVGSQSSFLIDVP